MKVFKFGGASVRNAQAVRNMASIVERYKNEELLIVLSAMGKTTNALESIWQDRLAEKNIAEKLEDLRTYHFGILHELIPDTQHPAATELAQWFEQLNNYLQKVDSNANRYYDALISFGELVSSHIVAHYLNHIGCPTQWLDAREVIATDNTAREGKIDWEKTHERCNQLIKPNIKNKRIITQGFIGKSEDGYTTTLGREGSDFTAAIVASCLQAESVSIWKDVPGILNCDPKLFADAVKFEELSYQEAAEMTYYGASVIHPKTIKPLANKNIPLWVKSFEAPEERGTLIHDCIMGQLPPCIIIKPNQCLITFKVTDFTFINEENLSLIFHSLDALNIKINVMQNTAISFSICVDNQDYKIKALINRLQDHFKILYNEDLTLATVKNYSPEVIKRISEGKKIYLEQRSRSNFQAVMA
ncbi:aspartate kinase [Cytophagales bacterium LB-30]|uniref:Aspartokinase n=1 Tax=Shiella aurantiaca TaxID=3058365 RepID=A0ABT8F8X4_9BACT|nr:aspartate kinase [Shiella aurantiaca]MDN4166932.1 aspartate kinase [Shiella aurantiaca]